MKPQSAANKQANKQKNQKPSREEAEEAVRTLISWAGDDPDRQEVLKTPSRVVKSFEEHFAGYEQDPSTVFGSEMEKAKGYSDMVVLKDITIHSYCQHHMLPILGKAHIAYWPDGELPGLSKFIRLTNIFAKRMTSQEIMTYNIRNAIDEHLQTLGAAVVVEAKHLCMTTRGITSPDVFTTTSSYSGVFEKNDEVRERFLKALS